MDAGANLLSVATMCRRIYDPSQLLPFGSKHSLSALIFFQMTRIDIIYKFVFTVAWGLIGSALDSLPDVPQFESRSGHLSPVSSEFTPRCSRPTQPSHPLAGRQNEEMLGAVATPATFPRFISPQARELTAQAGIRLGATKQVINPQPKLAPRRLRFVGFFFTDWNNSVV